MPMLRTMLERLSRNWVLKRRLPADLGSRQVYVSPDAALRFWRRGLESADPVLFRLARHFVEPGAIVWDVGANVGLFSFASAALAGESGRVVSVEADSWIAGLLRRSARPFPGHAPVTVVNAAVSDRVTLLDFNVAQRGRCSNFVSGFGTTQTSGSRASFPVIAVTLDWLAERFPKPNVLKVDIEGMDYLALRGAKDVLKNRPVIISEIQSSEAAEVEGLLAEYGYRFFNTDLQPVHDLPYDTVAIPY